MANPRRRSHALRCSGAGGWSVGLPETIFPTASLALASVVLALGVGRTGFPKRPFIKADGSCIKAGQPMAVLSRMAAVSRLRTRPVAAMAVFSIRSVQMARSVDLGCGWSISYYPAQAVYQRPGRAFLERAGKAVAALSDRPAAMAALSKPASSKASYKLLTKLLLNFLLKLRLVLFLLLVQLP